MSVYVDSSALAKRYVDEPESRRVDEYLAHESTVITAMHSIVEVRAAIARCAGPSGREQAELFTRHTAFLTLVDLDRSVCDSAATIAETLGVRTLDALHLAAAQRVGGSSLPFLTFDIRQAQAARALGFTVLGV